MSRLRHYGNALITKYIICFLSIGFCLDLVLHMDRIGSDRHRMGRFRIRIEWKKRVLVGYTIFVRCTFHSSNPFKSDPIRNPSSSNHPLDIHWTDGWYDSASRIISKGYPVTSWMSCTSKIPFAPLRKNKWLQIITNNLNNYLFCI